MPTVKEVVEQLPPDRQEEVKNFAEFLLEKRRGRAKGKPDFDWAGALKNLRDDYTSVELQHEIADMMHRRPSIVYRPSSVVHRLSWTVGRNHV